MRSEKAVRRPLNRVEQEFGRYRIIAGAFNDTFQAIAYLGRRKVTSVIDSSSDAAVERLTEILDERVREMVERRPEGSPTMDEFVEALDAIAERITAPQRTMLLYHLRAPSKQATTLDVGGPAQISELSRADAHYAQFGRMLAQALDFEPSVVGMKPQLQPILAFATAELRPEDGLWMWTLRPAFTAALMSRPLEPDWSALHPIARGRA